MGIFPQPLVLSWMGPSVDQMVQGVVTAREINVQPDQLRQAGRQTPAPPSEAPLSPTVVASSRGEVATEDPLEGSATAARPAAIH